MSKLSKSNQRILFFSILSIFVLTFGTYLISSAEAGAVTEVTILKSVDEGQPVEGDEIEYTVVFTNNEGVSLASVIITDSLPTGVTFVSASATQGSYNDSTGQWSVGTVANAASATLTITVSVDSGTGTDPRTTITNTASYTSSTPTATNPTESDSVPIQPLPTTTFTGNGDGISWSDDANWDNDNPATFGATLSFTNEGVFIPNGFTVYGDTSYTITGRMVMDSGSEFVIKSSTNFNNDQDMLIKSSATVTVYGTFSSSGSGDVNNGTIVDCGNVTDWTGTVNTSPCDVAAPSPVITSGDVANGGTTNEADGIIEFNVDFGELIAPLTFGIGDISVTAGTGAESTPTTTDNRNYQFSVDSGTAVESAVTVQLTVGGTATDLAGNTQTATPSYSYTIDNVPPTIASITSVATDAAPTGVLGLGDSILFTATLGAEAAASVTGSYNGVALTWTTADAGVTFTATYTVALTQSDQLTAIQIGGVTADDAAGNTSAAAAGTDVTLPIDATPPVIASVAFIPTSGLHGIGDSFDMRITTNPESGLIVGTNGIEVNDVATTGFTDNTDGTYDVTYTVADTHTDRLTTIPVSVMLQDPAGNDSLEFTTSPAANVSPEIDATRPLIASVAFNPTSGLHGIGDSFTMIITTNPESGLIVGSNGIEVNDVATTGFLDNTDGTYDVTYTVVEGHTDRLTTIPVSVMLQDPAGNDSLEFTTSPVAGDSPEIDATRPTVTIDNNSFTTSLDTGIIVADKDVADGDTLHLTLTFDSKMLTTGFDPAFAFPATSTLDFDAGTGAFTVGQTVTGTTSGATGVIDVIAGTVSDGTLTISSLGVATFQDNEPITDPITGAAKVKGTIMENDVSSSPATLVTPTAGAWTTTNPAFDVFDRTWNLADVGVTEAGIDNEVSGAKDLAGNTMVANEQTDAFDVDTENPEIAPATLTITSNNAGDPNGDTDYAKSGDRVTITLTAKENLRAVQTGDASANGIADTDSRIIPSVANAVFTLLYDPLTGDQQGIIPFTIDCFDLVGNQCAPATANVPATATNTHLTNTNQEIILDTDAPSVTFFRIEGQTTPNDIPANDRTTSRAVNYVQTCDDTSSDVTVTTEISGCFRIASSHDGGALGTFGLISAFDAAAVDETLDPQRGDKSGLIQVMDRATNTVATLAGSQAGDTIKLDAFFSDVVYGIAPAAPTPPNVQDFWEDYPTDTFDIDVAGKLTHPETTGGTDKVRVDFGYDPILTTILYDFPLGYTHPSNFVVVSLTQIGTSDVYTFTTNSADSRDFPRPTQDQVQINSGTPFHRGEVTLVEQDGTTDVSETVNTPDTTVDAPGANRNPGMGSSEVDAFSSNQAEVLQRPTNIVTEPIEDVYGGQNVGIVGGSGGLQDALTDIGISDEPVQIVYENGDFPDVTTADGLTILDNDLIVIADNAAGTKVAKLKQPTGPSDTGGQILTPYHPGFIALLVESIGEREAELLVTDANGEESNVFQESADLLNPTLITISDPDGIASIEFKLMRDRITDLELGPLEGAIQAGETLDISEFTTFGNELELIENHLLVTDETVSRKTFDFGIFFSETGAQLSPAENLQADLTYFDSSSPNWQGATGSEDSDVLFNNAGFGTGSATIVEDNGRGIGVVSCLGGGGDDDFDGICDDWEINGVPFWDSGATRRMILSDFTYGFGGTGPTVGKRDIFVEIDHQTGTSGDALGSTTTGDHTPDSLALADVVGLYAAAPPIPNPTGTSLIMPGIDLHIVVDQAIAHHDTWTMWQDGGGDTDRTNDFNANKAVNFGFVSTAGLGANLISPTVTQTQVNTFTDDGGGDFTIEINGLDVTTPCVIHSVPPGRTEGFIQSKIIVVTDPVGIDISLNGATTRDTSAPNFGGGFFFGAPRVTAVNNFATFSVILYDFAVTGRLPFGNDCDGNGVLDFPVRTVGELTIPIHLASAGTINTLSTPDELPKIISHYRKAWAQVARYFVWGHSYGGPSGLAESRGNDAIVTLGQGFLNSFNGHPGGSRHEQSGTFAHELGHLVNLGHGGPIYLRSDGAQTELGDTDKNCKPIYHSIMSYSRQLPTVNFLALDTVGGTPQGDVITGTSQWLLEFSDGTHGYNPLEALASTSTDPMAGSDHVAVLMGLGATTGGLDENDLDESVDLPGSSKFTIWGTPTTSASHSSPDNFLTALSDNGAGFDWNDSDGTSHAAEVDNAGMADTANVVADINNFGVSGCDDSIFDPEYYDYADFFHMDLDFKQGPSGQFDGITKFIPDPDVDFIWQTIAASAAFDGADQPNEDGSTVANAGRVVFVSFDLEDQNGDPIILQDKALVEVFLTKDPTATNTVPGVSDGDGNPETGDPRIEWILMRDHNPLNLTPLEMFWDSDTSSLTFEIKTQKTGKKWFDIPGLNIEGDWFGRLNAFNRPNAGAPTVCTTSDQTLITDPDGPDNIPGTADDETACLFGAEGNPSQNWLIDVVDPSVGGTTLPAGEREIATFKFKITKDEPGEPEEEPPVPGEQDQPELDALLALLNQLQEDKEVKKGTSKGLRDTLNLAKAEFIIGGIDDFEGCGFLDAFRSDVNSATDRQVSADAKLQLTTGVSPLFDNGVDFVQAIKCPATFP